LGSIKCDTPTKLLDKALDYIESNIPEIDIVIVTGDYSAHNEWEKTPQTVIEVRNIVENKIRDKVKAQYIFTAPGNN
jgi:3',5'-cyclic AMP phosphodiesterase CpdA